MSMQQVYLQEFNAVNITIPQAPAGDDSQLVITAEEGGGSVPVGVASQWFVNGNGKTWFGIGPFSGNTIKVVEGRTPNPVIRKLQEYAVV